VKGVVGMLIWKAQEVILVVFELVFIGHTSWELKPSWTNFKVFGFFWEQGQQCHHFQGCDGAYGLKFIGPSHIAMQVGIGKTQRFIVHKPHKYGGQCFVAKVHGNSSSHVLCTFM
jgi:hypothetical protein